MKTEHSDYYYTFMGQLEYFLVAIMEEAFRRNLQNWPSTYYGGLNCISLYLYHPAYSPFVPMAYYCEELMPLDWRQNEADRIAKELEQSRERRNGR